MEIVGADASRLDELEPLYVAMHEHHRAGRPRASDVRAFRPDEEAWERRREHYRGLFDAGRAHLLIAQEGGRAIGYAMVSETGSQATLQVGERTAELESLSVLPEARGAGVGTALMAAVHELVRGSRDRGAAALRHGRQRGRAAVLRALRDASVPARDARRRGQCGTCPTLTLSTSPNPTRPTR